MRIAIICEVFVPKIDGVVIRTLNLLHHLKQAGDEVLVICPKAAEHRHSTWPLLEFRSFPFPSYPEYRIGIPDRRLISELECFAPDIVHFINPFAFGFRCHDMLSKSKLELPSVFSFHTLYGEFAKQYGGMKSLSRLLWWMTRDYHNLADTNLSVSSTMRDELTERGFQNVALWPPAVDSDLFHPNRASQRMRNKLCNGNTNCRLLLTVSRLAAEKNVAFLHSVMQQLNNVHLAIVGDGPQRKELEALFDKSKTTFIGYLEGKELASAYASADAFLYASETETMGNVVLEAMASGRCVVAPRSAGIPSLIVDRESGWLYTPRQTDEVVHTVEHLLTNSRLRRSTEVSARHFAEQCSWSRAVDCVRGQYASTIRQHRDHSLPQVRRPPKKKHWLAPAVLSLLVSACRTASVIRGR